MTREGRTPLTPLTTARLQNLLQTWEAELRGLSEGVADLDDVRTTAHAIAELIDIRHQIERIAAACPDKDTANALIELVGTDE